jgi:2-hydroxy-6-oxonona-2,4-dienedioate hydrolase
MCATNILTCLPNIQAPTLVVFGRQDGVVPVKQGYLAAEHIPNAQLVVLDQCGHYPMYEQPEAFLNSLRQFLAA